MWQGLDDQLVPDPINKAVADAMPGAVWHPVEGAGHFVAVGAGDDDVRHRGQGTGRGLSRWWPRSLAGQAIALQILVIAVVVLAGSALALFDARQRR